MIKNENPSSKPKPNDGTRRTFVIPDGHYPVLDEDGRATGEVLPLPAPASQNNGSEK
ncbi:hypothetical protein GA0004734_00032550 [Rhizobium sp. 9140]|nr:hypothetical protein GA0004734_00032550 [Rhizobium sp. 9140]